MSRIGKKPIPLPGGVKVQIGEELEVSGPKGKLKVPIPEGIKVVEGAGKLEIQRSSDDHAALHGLTRALVANAVHGVSSGFTKELDIVGIGYRADVKGKIATFTLGYSHPIELLLPDGVDMRVDKVSGSPIQNLQARLVLTGYDRQMLGQVAANIRSLRKPDPYKNKGIRYTGEALRKKVGKTGASAK
ncbi:MAG: 50S ribosomal protein L6 [Bryobacteraceae bacterium]